MGGGQVSDDVRNQFVVSDIDALLASGVEGAMDRARVLEQESGCNLGQYNYRYYKRDGAAPHFPHNKALRSGSFHNHNDDAPSVFSCSIGGRVRPSSLHFLLFRRWI